MIAELIAVGTELLLGSIANTDAQMISQHLSAMGITVLHHTVVGDNPQRLAQALETARDRADIIITTGGLGPTYDDLTKQTICQVFGRELELHEDILEEIRAWFQTKMGKTMPENNVQQALLPVNCTVFDNPVGTAPGCAFEENGVHVLMLPGPPFECRYMFENRAAQYLEKLTDGVIVSHEIKIFGMGESSVEEALRVPMTTLANPTLAPYAKLNECMVRATAKAETREAAEDPLERVLLCNGRILAACCFARGEPVYKDETEALADLTGRQMEQLLLRLAEGGGCEDRRPRRETMNPKFDAERFEALRGE